MLKNLSDADLFPDADLFRILDIPRLKTLIHLLAEEGIESLLGSLDKNDFPKLNRHKISSALFEALSDVPSYPLYILCTIIAMPTLISSGVLIPILCVVGILTIALNIFFCMTSYKKLKKESSDLEQSLCLLLLKKEIANELISRLEPQSALALNLEINEEEPSDTTQYKLKRAISAAIFSATTLFVWYYLSIPFLAQTLGAYTIVSCTTGPIGLCIALCLTLGIGIYFGYKNYQLQNDTEVTIQFEQQLTQEVAAKQSILSGSKRDSERVVSTHSIFSRKKDTSESQKYPNPAFLLSGMVCT